MGLTTPGVRFLIEARAAGVRFDSTLMLGRQALFANPLRVQRMMSRAGAWESPQHRSMFLDDIGRTPGHADPVFRALGADVLHAMDASPYEGADIVHDLNEPMPDELAESYTTVFDGGTLEHVFNLPTALETTLSMVRRGGHFVAGVVANNEFGHGFYQFSPEFFFRTLTRENGFEVKRMVAFEAELEPMRVGGIVYPYERFGPFREVHDDRRWQGRHVLISRRPVQLLLVAERVGTPPFFVNWPQQSDYVAAWTPEDAADPPEEGAPAPAPAAEPAPPPPSLRTRVAGRLTPRVRATVWFALIGTLGWIRRPFDSVLRLRIARKTSLANRDLYPPAGK